MGGQMLANKIQGKDVMDIDYADVAFAAVEGAIIGLTGGLGATTKAAKTIIKVTKTVAVITSASAQGAIDKKAGQNMESIFDKTKDLDDAMIDGGINLLGAGAGSLISKIDPVAKMLKNAKGPIPVPSVKKAVKAAKNEGASKSVVKQVKKNTQEAKKVIKASNEIIKEVVSVTAIPGATGENIASDRAKGK